MPAWSELFWAIIGALVLGVPIGATMASQMKSRSKERLDEDRKSLGLTGQPTPGPWKYHSITSRVMASSVLIIDMTQPGPLYQDGCGLSPNYKDPLGMAVCESVNRDDGPLIAAAPALLEVAELLLRLDNTNQCGEITNIKTLAHDAVASIQIVNQDLK